MSKDVAQPKFKTVVAPIPKSELDKRADSAPLDLDTKVAYSDDMLYSKEYYDFYYSNPTNFTNPRLRKPLYNPKEIYEKGANGEEDPSMRLTLECLNIVDNDPSKGGEEEQKKLMKMIDILDNKKGEAFNPKSTTVENQYNMMFTPSQQPWSKEAPLFQPQYVPPPMMYTYVDPNYIAPTPIYFPNPTPQFMMPNQAKPFYPYASKPKQMGQTSPFLEDFKLKMNAPKISATEFRGHVYELSKDHNGSKFIQQKIESGDDEEKQMIFKEIIESPSDIIKDVFGNYVVQKILENSNLEIKRQIALKMKGQVKALSLDPYGCRVLQKAIELLSNEEQINLCEELDGFVKSCVDNQNGNHVIQKCVERMAIQSIGFIVNYFNSNIIEMSKHNYGCRVIQRLLEKNQTYPTIREMVGKLIKSVEELAMDAFGNYVIQHVIEHGTVEDIAMVHSIVRKNLYVMSKQKFSSNVIEKALHQGTDAQKRDLIRVITKEENGMCILGDMMKDKFANYVVQKCIEHSDITLLKELQAKICKVTDQNQYCYHVQNALNKKLESLKSCK